MSLVESDDSDSDMDSGEAAQSVFGGLEFMIKEARRTAEVTAALRVTGTSMAPSACHSTICPSVCPSVPGVQAQTCHRLREGEQPRQNPGGSARHQEGRVPAAQGGDRQVRPAPS